MNEIQGEPVSKMNPEVKARWVAALRSGEYDQTTQVLKDAGGGHCCLGVLCDLYAHERGLQGWDSRSLGSKDEEVPSPEVCRWAGLGDENNPRISIGGVHHFASNHNDAGRTFTEIADAIEAQL